MVGGGAFFVFVHHHAAALGTHVDFVFGVFKVALIDFDFVAAAGKQGGFVDQVGQVGAGETGCAARQRHQIDGCVERYFFCVYVENLLAAADIGQRHDDLAVETAGALQGGVEYVGAVGGGHDDYGFIAVKAVHFHQKLVEGLFALVVAAAESGAALAADGVDFVDKDDAGGVFLGLFEHVAHAAGADADEHFNEIRAGNAEKRYARFAGDRFGQQGFAGAGAAGEQDAVRHAAAEALVAVGRFEVIDDFLHFFFGFVAAGHIGEGYDVGVFIQQAGAAFAEGKRTAFAAAALGAHKVEKHAHQQQQRQPAHQQAAEKAGFFFVDDFETDFVVGQRLHQFVVQRRVGNKGRFFAVFALAFDHIAGGRAFQAHIVDVAAFDLLDKLRILDLLGAAAAVFHHVLQAEKYGQQQNAPQQEVF